MSVPTFNILVVDDDPSLLRLITIRLEAAGYGVIAVDNPRKALSLLETETPDLLISDLQMEEMDGRTLFNFVKARYPGLPVIILTAHGSIPDAVDATQQGVFDYLTKPFESNVLLDRVAKAIEISTHNIHSSESEHWCQHIIAKSPVMSEVLSQAKQVAQSDIAVMIQGESGTGKELLAKAIHLASPRNSGPFIAVNCGAIPETLLESELFGHVKGAFTGAHKDHQGLFSAASGGTLFLDEVADMPLSFQVKLLRVLQEQEVKPVGSFKCSPIDVRIITATHKNLEELIQNNEFREDLFYRLNVVDIQLPNLAQRREDIPVLIDHFMAKFRDNNQVDVQSYSPDATALLLTNKWTGNVRQLQNVIERTMALSTTKIVPENLVSQALKEKPESLTSFTQAKTEFEQQYLAQLLRMTNGNVSRASKMAQRNRTEFYKLLEKHHLDPESFRT